MAVAQRVEELDAQFGIAEEKPRGTVIEFDPTLTAARGTLPGEEPEPAEMPEVWLYDGIEANDRVKAALSRRRAAHMPLPMEDVYLPMKTVGNRGVRRAADPASAHTLLKRVGVGVFLVLLVYAGWGAHSALRQTGYDTEEALTSQQKLADENRRLHVDYAERNDPTRILRMATEEGFVVPQAAQVAWQDGPAAREREGSRVARAGVYE